MCTIGEWLAEQRRARGVTQAEVADACGVDQPMISRWERGTGRPYADQLARWAQALGLTPAEIADGMALLAREAA